MKLTARALAAGAFVLALGALSLSAYPSVAEEAGVDIWQVVEDRRRIVAACDQQAALARDAESTARRMALRREAVRDVIDGRISFREGVHRFAELNLLQPGTVAEYTRRRFPGRTPEECAARQLVCQLRVAGEPRALALAGEWECLLDGRGAVTGRSEAFE
jgi:hypothetical protein